MTERWDATADVVVVGSGVAGLTAALDLAVAGLTVVVVTQGAVERMIAIGSSGRGGE